MTFLASQNNMILIASISLGLLVIFLYLELKRVDTRRIFLRIACISLAVLALAFVALQPAYTTKRLGSTAILLTPHYSPKRLDSLKQIYRDIAVYAYQTQDTVGYQLADLSLIRKKDSNLTHLQLLGVGIPSYVQQDLEELQVQSYPFPKISGITDISYTSPIILGNTLNVQLQYANYETKPVEFIAHFAGIPIDSLQMDTLGSYSFTFTHKPKAEGNYLYQLQTRDSLGNMLKSYTLPLVVDPAPILPVSYRQQIPDFESRNLKNWLGETDHPVVFQLNITKGNQRTEYINIESTPVGNITPQMLEAFELIILDASAWQSLAQSEKEALETAVRDGGISLLILANEDLLTNVIPAKEKAFFFDFNWRKDERKTFTWGELGATYNWDKLPYHIRLSDRVFSIIPEIEDQAPAAWYRKGKGKIGISLIQRTYLKRLQGQPDVYASLWQKILNTLAPIPWDQPRWELPDWAYQSIPTPIGLYTTIKNPYLRYRDTLAQAYPIYLAQHPLDPTFWQSTYWPTHTKWHQLTLMPDSLSTRPLYVFPDTVWQSLRYRRDRRSLESYLSETLTDSTLRYVKPLKLIPPWIFYLLFILAMGIRWVEQKW